MCSTRVFVVMYITSERKLKVTISSVAKPNNREMLSTKQASDFKIKIKFKTEETH